MSSSGHSPRPIVCGVDHSPGARAAAGIAFGLAGTLGAPLALVHAVPLPPPSREMGVASPTSFAVVDEMREAGVTLLDEIAAELGGDHEIGRDVQVGGAAEVIRTAAENAGAGFVVVGSRGLGSVGAVLLGSVSRSLATRGPCPTLIVPGSASPVGQRPVVCAADDSDGAHAALTTAAGLAERLGSELVLVTAETDDHAAADGVRRMVTEAGLETRAELVVARGEPATAIVEAADARRAGMIVIGSRGRGALAASVLGSVSASVAGLSACPVLVVRAAA